METLEAMKVSLTKNPFDLGIETEVRRWFVLRVDLEVLHNRVDTRSQHLSNAAYASSAGITPPGRNTTACRVDIAASLLADPQPAHPRVPSRAGTSPSQTP